MPGGAPQRAPKCTKVEQDGDISPDRQTPERKDGPGNSLEKYVQGPAPGHPRKLSVSERISASADAIFFSYLKKKKAPAAPQAPQFRKREGAETQNTEETKQRKARQEREREQQEETSGGGKAT